MMAVSHTEVATVLAMIRAGEKVLVRQELYEHLMKNNRAQVMGSLEHSADSTPFAQSAVPVSEPMLHRAEQLINGARQQEYGDKLRNLDQIADFWNAHLKYKLAPGCKVTAEDVALMMIGVKQARLAKTPTHEDSVLDIAGYIGCYDKILSERRTRDEEVNQIRHPAL